MFEKLRRFVRKRLLHGKACFHTNLLNFQIVLKLLHLQASGLKTRNLTNFITFFSFLVLSRSFERRPFFKEATSWVFRRFFGLNCSEISGRHLNP